MKHNCACTWWTTARECMQIQMRRGYDPDDMDTMEGEECECPCHARLAALWEGEEPDDD